MKVLIVGAGGFIGGFIARESLSRGYETWCAVRESTSRRYLTDPALNFITLDYDDTDKLRAALEGKKWDYIVYNLGATKCVNFNDFNHINFTYLRNFCEALIANDQVPERFLYISSLSAIGPGDEKTYIGKTWIEVHDDKLVVSHQLFDYIHVRCLSTAPWRYNAYTI